MPSLMLIIICVLAILLVVPFVLMIFASLGSRHKNKKHRG